MVDTFRWHELRNYARAEGNVALSDNDICRYVGAVADRSVESALDMCAIGEIPIHLLLHRLQHKHVVQLAQLHHLCIPRCGRDNMSLTALFTQHECNINCHYHCLFTMDSVEETNRIRQEGVFPPDPPSVRCQSNFVRSWCEAISGCVISESSCVVCARLVNIRDLNDVDGGSINLGPLIRDSEGVTRVVRCNDCDPVREESGPILYAPGTIRMLSSTSYRICSGCLKALKRHKLPREALANGLWLGDVPSQLGALNFMERLLVARVRHNYFVAQVHKGQRKLCANAVMFQQPIAKLVNVLPPPHTDMEECIAILFIGACAPTPADYTRMPFIVRHSVVYDALQWLKRNHSDYEDILISLINLASYPSAEPPVAVTFRKGDSTMPAESLAVYDVDEERGSEQGTCVVVVHALTGTEFATMSYDQKKAAALKHFESGGKAVAFGRDSEPESIFHNPRLYPGMFPWLFPFGVGGFENGLIRMRLDRIAHVRHLLMYADRRFQVDQCFPFLAFNHEQIRASSSGGFLLTARRNFPVVVDKIMTLDENALNALIERGKNGEYVRGGSDAEKQCFELMSIVDHVAGHVQGSATSRKHMRSEIKLLIISRGVPVFFITFAPVDIKSPICLYYCGEKIDLMSALPNMPSEWECMQAIASNPVACARFFHLMVQTFVEHILKCGSGEEGLFGETEAYYGTVEAQ